MISLWHRALFVHIPKCGGQSIEEAFLADIDLTFNQHRRLFLCLAKPEAPEAWPGPPRLAHLRARDYVEMNYVSQRLFGRLYRFAIVRNPFAKVESHWRYRHGDIDFHHFVMTRLPKLVKNQSWFYGTQASYICGEDGSLLVEDVFHLEDMKDSWPKIQARCGIKAPLAHKNRSKVATPVTWTGGMVETVRGLFAADFALLGYPAEAPAPRTAGA